MVASDGLLQNYHYREGNDYFTQNGINKSELSFQEISEHSRLAEASYMEDLLRQTGGKTDAEALAKVGLKIGSNDDIAVVSVPLEPGHVAVVSDGVGGEIGGQVASKNAVNGALDAVHDFSAQRGVALPPPDPVKVFDPTTPISDIHSPQPSVVVPQPSLTLEDAIAGGSPISIDTLKRNNIEIQTPAASKVVLETDGSSALAPKIETTDMPPFAN